MITTVGVFAIVIVVVAILLVFMGVKSVPQGREWTVERYGRYTKTLRPGLNLLFPFVDRVRRQGQHDGAGARRADPGSHHQGQRKW